jgi:hypothetical protein
MSRVQTKDLAVMFVLALDFLVVAPAVRYPLWTVHSPLFRAALSSAAWIGLISAVGLPIWLVIRLVRESAGRALKVVELIGAVCWLVAIGYMVVTEFPII